MYENIRPCAVNTLSALNLSDYHVHTNFCDGKNTPEEMVNAALKLGMSDIGFSGHAHVAFDEEYTMSPDGTEEYKREIKRLTHKYENKIRILCGVEQDYYSDLPIDDYDYVICSVHTLFFNHDKNFVHVDLSADALCDAVNKYFNDNFYALTELYYKYEADLINKIINKNNTKQCIIGHFDLITKFNENSILFDENDERYVKAAYDALDELIKTGCPFEINTGAMSRGYKSVPYPNLKILKRIAEKDGKVILSSDSHNAGTLCYKFKECRDIAQSLGLEIIKL